MLVLFLQYALTHVIARHDIQLGIVKLSGIPWICIMSPDMIMFQMRNHCPESLTHCHSLSSVKGTWILSHGNTLTRTQSTKKKATLSTNGSDRGSSLWGKSAAAMRTHVSKQCTRLPTTRRLVSVCIDLNSKSEVQSRKRAMEFCPWQGVMFSFSIYTHTHTNIQITRGVLLPLSDPQERHPWITCRRDGFKANSLKLDVLQCL